MGNLHIKLKSRMKIHYLVSGSEKKQELVLLHGYPSNCLLWRHCIPALSEHFRVIVPDLPGHGKSDKPDNVKYDLDFLTGFLLDFYDSLGLKQPHLAAHDLGGMAALGFVTRYPERVNQFVIMDTAPYVDWPWALEKMVKLLRKRLVSKTMLRPAAFKQALKRSLFYDPKVVDDEMTDLYLKPWIESKAGKKAFRQVIMPSPEDVTVPREKLQQISVPTLVLWAENDKLLPKSVARKLSKDIPGASLAFVPNSGHFLPDEQPGVVVEKMLGFLT